MEKIVLLLAKELNIRPAQAEAALQLLDDGNTVPFIARYRKEATGSLDEEQIRNLEARAQYTWRPGPSICVIWIRAGKKF